MSVAPSTVYKWVAEGLEEITEETADVEKGERAYAQGIHHDESEGDNEATRIVRPL